MGAVLVSVRDLAPVRHLVPGLVVGLVALGCSSPPAAGDERVSVVASMSIIADFAEQIGGDEVEVSSLVPVGSDPHVYEPTPSDARAIDDADLVLGNGVGLEPWFDALVAGSGREVITLTDRVGHAVVADDAGEPDPHLWMVPPFAVAYVEVIAEELIAVDPGNAAAYADNAASYIDRLEALDEELAEALAVIDPDRRILVTPHDAYSYFADHYGFEVETIVGVTTEEEPSAARAQRLVDHLRRHDVPTVFVESTVNPSVIERIAADAGVQVGEPLYGDSVGGEGSGAEDYHGMMRANVRALVDGLGP
jgi:ABC-type Zn uptake system ZnuABC Zn-binding protein ZnuA